MSKLTTKASRFNSIDDFQSKARNFRRHFVQIDIFTDDSQSGIIFDPTGAFQITKYALAFNADSIDCICRERLADCAVFTSYQQMLDALQTNEHFDISFCTHSECQGICIPQNNLLLCPKDSGFFLGVFEYIRDFKYHECSNLLVSFFPSRQNELSNICYSRINPLNYELVACLIGEIGGSLVTR